VSLCAACGSLRARAIDQAIVSHAGAERLILDLAGLVAVRVVVHRVTLVECPDCRPGFLVRRRYTQVPLEEAYGKGYLRARRSRRLPRRPPVTSGSVKN
jgi:hypothetical protein